MAYSEFSLAQVVRDFGLLTAEREALFDAVPEVPPTPHLQETLRRNVAVALAVATEKARSELIIAPILMELRVLYQGRISCHSGTDFDVDPARGLAGFCDFLISRAPDQNIVRAPVAVVAEAKRGDVASGRGQCVAGMVAAQLFNEREGNGVGTVYGMVTTGSDWQPVQLEGRTVTFDRQLYYISQPAKILGILRHMVGPVPEPAP